MSRDFVNFDVAITPDGQRYAVHATSPVTGPVTGTFVFPFSAVELAHFMIAVGPARVPSRRLRPTAERAVDVKESGRRLGEALLAGEIDHAFRESLSQATSRGQDLRLRLRLDGVPELDSVPWEYVYDSRLDRFLALSQETPLVRFVESLERPPVVAVRPPLRVLVMISSPSDVPSLAVDREKQLLQATTGDLVSSGLLQLDVLEDATLTQLQRSLLEDYHVFHFIGHGGFDQHSQQGVLALEKEDGTAHRVSGARLGTLLNDARTLQLVVLNACEGARTSGRDAFSGVGQALVRRGVPAVVAMQTEISDRAALVFSHELYWYLTRGLGIEAAMSEVRKAMAVADEASEWGTAVLLRSGSEQPFSFTASPLATPSHAGPSEAHLGSLYAAAQGAILADDTSTALPILEHIADQQPDYEDVTQLIQLVHGADPAPRVHPTDKDRAGHARPERPAEWPSDPDAVVVIPVITSAKSPVGRPTHAYTSIADYTPSQQETDPTRTDDDPRRRGPRSTRSQHLTSRGRTVALVVSGVLLLVPAGIGIGVGVWQSQQPRTPTGFESFQREIINNNVPLTVQLSRTSGPAGTRLKVSGGGFFPNEPVKIEFLSRRIGSTTADGQGRFSNVVVTIPSGYDPSPLQFSIRATGEASQRSGSAPFDITRS